MTTRAFPPEIFARLAPQQYMERHIEAGVRPSGRRFDEPRTPHIQIGDQNINSLGSAVVRLGECTVICGIVGGLTDFEGEGGIYANVKMHRMGRTGIPTPEEQCLSQTLDEQIRAAAFPKDAFKIEVTDQITDSHKELVLRADIQVLSRTGPCLDPCWQVLVAALKDTKVPTFKLDERTGEIKASMEGAKPLELPSTLASQSYNVGLLKGQLLADIDGATEESSVPNVVNVFKCDNGMLSGVYLHSPHESFTVAQLRSILG